MIVYIIIISALVVFTVLAILEYCDKIDTNGVVSGIWLIILVGLVFFSSVDDGLRKNAEKIPMTATVTDTYAKVNSNGKSSSISYFIYVKFEDGHEERKKVSYRDFKQYSEGETVDGYKVYYTTGITNINTYAYEVEWK